MSSTPAEFVCNGLEKNAIGEKYPIGREDEKRNYNDYPTIIERAFKHHSDNLDLIFNYRNFMES